MNTFEGNLVAENIKIGIVVARFNEFITSKLLAGALDNLKRENVGEKDIEVAWVPGAFEIPLIASKMAKSKKYDAIICLGAVIRGSTSHYDYVCSEVSKGIAQISLNKLAVQRNGSRTGGKTYHTGGLCLNNGFKFISGSPPHIFGIFHLNEIHMQHFTPRIRQDSAFANSMCRGTYRLEISPLSIREALCSLRYLHSRWADPPVGALQSDMGQPHHWLLQRHAPYPTHYSRDLYQG